jgi:hypothetical protein
LKSALPNPPVIFLDRNHGLLIREILLRVKLSVVSHKDLGWHPDMPDVNIIRECAARNYVILSGDKSMERVPEERQAIIDGKCKVFMFGDTDKTRTEDWVASVLIGRQRILDIIRKTEGPLFVTIKPCRTIGHVGNVRFVEKAGGRWLAEGETAPPPLELEHTTGPMRPHRKQQGEFDFSKS